MVTWRDDLYTAVSNAEDEGADISDIYDYLLECTACFYPDADTEE